MPKLYFKYGVMGSSKTAQALMYRFNYEQQGFEVTLLKPSLDTRDVDKDGNIVCRSRVGLEAKCVVFDKEENLYKLIFGLTQFRDRSVVIVDESQFLTTEQVNQLKEVSAHIPVNCYGLLTNFKTELFEGSKRLVETADVLQEIKFICECGNRANVNARFIDGKITVNGEEILIGKEDYYKPLCYNCFLKSLRESGEASPYAQD
ncbi:MAG: thymidine kinase [Clostridiales bacterium]|nr:thymidine kinase [Clostridiales bacterium]